MNKKFIFSIIKIILKTFVVLYFWINRWIVHSKFKYELNSDVLGRPSLISYPFIFLYKITLKICDLFFFEFGNYALSKYKNLSKEHYSEQGIAYSHLKNITHEQKKQFYLNGRSRLEYFYNNNQYLLHFKNGQVLVGTLLNLMATIFKNFIIFLRKVKKLTNLKL